ncbi:MAG: transcriptional repressor [Tolypothrix carrinoi HA7290-LM1]|nr:transcriptional repressor [Tolypothrix carrinoi HA7290-LM1]
MDLPGSLKEKLNAKGWRFTAQREMIFLIFQNLPKANHISAEDVWDSLLQRGEKISLSTVYRNLKLMTQMGLLRELEFTEGHKKYELNTDSIIHYHIVCVLCNQTIEFENNLVIRLRRKAEGRGQRAEGINYVFDSAFWLEPTGYKTPPSTRWIQSVGV